MHFERAAMVPSCSEVGDMQIGLKTLSVGISNDFRLSGTFLSQNVERLTRIFLLPCWDRGGIGATGCGRIFGNALPNAVSSGAWDWSVCSMTTLSPS